MKTALLTILMACSALFATAQKEKITYQSFDYDKLVKAKLGPVKKDLKKKRVFIADFTLKQTTAMAASAQGFGGAGGGSAKASLALALSGVNEQHYQEMVNMLYAKTVEQLKAAGYEVVSDEEAAKAYQGADFGEKIIADAIGGQPKLFNKGGYALAEFRPAGKLIVIRDTEKLNSAAQFADGRAEYKIGRKMAEGLDAAVINITYNIGIAAMEANSSYLASVAQVKAWPMLIISQQNMVYGPKAGAMGTVYTKKSLGKINYWVENLDKKGKITSVSNASNQGYFGWSRSEATSPIMAREAEFLTEITGAVENLETRFVRALAD